MPYERFPARSGRIQVEKREIVPAKNIGVRALLASADIQTIDTLCHYMGNLAMHVDVCSDFVSATRKLCHSKYEAIVVDFKDAAAALELLKKSRVWSTAMMTMIKPRRRSMDSTRGRRGGRCSSGSLSRTL